MQRILALGAYKCCLCGSHRCWAGAVTQVGAVVRMLEHLRVESRGRQGRVSAIVFLLLRLFASL